MYQRFTDALHSLIIGKIVCYRTNNMSQTQSILIIQIYLPIQQI